jgi:outer membrane protein OmpA-like peptidoglycan-associated protein
LAPSSGISKVNIHGKLAAAIGDSCPDVYIDFENKTIVVKEDINFTAGKANILEEDLPLVGQLERTVVTLYRILKEVNYKMLHIRIDGHVHPTGKDMRCLVISYFRAAEMVRRIRLAGCPAEYLHAYGYGQRQPLTLNKHRADDNRRVDITIVDQHNVGALNDQAGALWKEISATSDFTKCVTTEGFFGHKRPPLMEYAPCDGVYAEDRGRSRQRRHSIGGAVTNEKSSTTKKRGFLANMTGSRKSVSPKRRTGLT